MDYCVLREKVRKAFQANRDVTEDAKIDKLLAHGNYIVNEMIAVIQLKKYRTLKRNYGAEWDGAYGTIGPQA